MEAGKPQEESTSGSKNPTKGVLAQNCIEEVLGTVNAEERSEESPKDEDIKMKDKDDICVWEDEGDTEEEERLTFGLIGRLWSDRILNPDAFMTTIKNVRVTQHGVDINMIGKNTFQFQFYHWKDKEKVLNGQPWQFDKVALLLAEMNDANKPSDIQFFVLPIWVRVYNVPFRGRYNINNARVLGNKIGEFIDMDKSENLGMEKALRIRVSIDVQESLKKQVTLQIRGGEMCICPVKYEKLPLIGFYCGKLGHGTNECKEVFGDNSPVKQYGAWLKASPWRPRKTDIDTDKEVHGKQV